MQPDVMMQMLKSLKLHGMAQALGELAAQDSPAYKSASLVLAGLLKAELAEREVRSLAYQMKVARFPAYRDIGGFDFSCSDANEALVWQLYGLILYARCAGHYDPGDVPHLIIGCVVQPVGPPGTSHFNLNNAAVLIICLHTGLNRAPSGMTPSFR